MQLSNPGILILALAATPTVIAAAIGGPADVAAVTILPRGTCPKELTNYNHCVNYCQSCIANCWHTLCVDGCMAAVKGKCTSHWNDGGTWAYRCNGDMDGYKLQKMRMNCWGDMKGEFWCQC